MRTVYFRFVQQHTFFAYRLAFSAITRNISTLNLLHTKIFNLSGFQKCAKFYTHEKFYIYGMCACVYVFDYMCVCVYVHVCVYMCMLVMCNNDFTTVSIIMMFVS